MERINEFLSLYKIPLALCSIGLVLIIGSLFFSKPPETRSINSKSIVSDKQLSGEIKVNISGAVQSPGVYTLSFGDRIEDAIKAAGGFDEAVNQDYVSKTLNLSKKLSDGEKVYLPFEGEAYSQAGGVAGTQTEITGLNSATQDQLEDLPGIGPVTAKKIIDSRPYSQVSDLISKKAVSNSVYEKIKDLVDAN